MLSKRLNTITSVRVQKMDGVCVHVCARERTCVCVCVFVYVQRAKQEEKTGASPLLSAALIYLDVHDVILPGGLPCQA